MRTSLAARTAILATLLASAGPLCTASAAQGSLDEAFRNPPASAKPHTWWHWMNGYITREGITADLEAMAEVGVGGAQIFDVAQGTPPGPVDYMSDEWRAMILHAAQEADRLGLELCMHNCSGWSSSGGPWVKPEHAMKMLVSTEARAAGPGRVELTLAQPTTRRDHYRDVVVLAFPTPPAETDMAALGVTVTASDPAFGGAAVLDGDPNTAATLPAADGDAPQFVDFRLARPATIRALTLASGTGLADRTEIQVSDNGADFRTVTAFGRQGSQVFNMPYTVSFEPVTGAVFRLLFTGGAGRRALVRVPDVTLETGARISNWAAKAGYHRANALRPDTVVAPADATVAPRGVLDISSSMDATGRLAWDAPEGDWTILRFGYTLTGAQNAPATDPGRGLEVDKLSTEAVTAFFEGMLVPVLSDLGPLGGKVLNNVLVDSYEVGEQNWTQTFREDFARLRGYDPLPWLPAMTGRVVASTEETERFLWDVRRTIADLYAECYFGGFAEFCHAHGMQVSIEPYGNGGFDDLTAGAQADIPMTEFWVGWGTDLQGGKLASSIAHTNGRRFVGAESFTTTAENGAWRNHPYSMKALGDLVYTGGVNRFIFHRYAHQPWTDLAPGMTMGPWGFHFERTNTWWSQGRAWLEYVARCQHLLQEGLFAADVCYFLGEDAPNSPPSRGGLNPALPAGYDYDFCNAGVVLDRMSVEGGSIVLPDGMRYRALVLPASGEMTPEVVRKVAALVRDGATVIGPRPAASPSLEGYPECDAEIEALAAEVWGACDGKTVTENTYGQGRVIWGKPIADAFADWGLGPDFEATTGDAPAMAACIHRTIGDAEIYFVSSQAGRATSMDCRFRIEGRQPELWHPETGVIEDAPAFRTEDGVTEVPLRFEPAESVFVVFRRPLEDTDPFVDVTRDGESLFTTPSAPGLNLEIRSAVYGVLNSQLVDMVDVTEQLRGAVADNRLDIAATNAIAGDPAQNVVKELRVDYTVGGEARTKTVAENARLVLPDPADAGLGALEIQRALYGLIPARLPDADDRPVVDVTEVIRGMVRDNAVTFRADNSLAGDPANLVPKQFRLEYALGGDVYSRVFNENAVVSLPMGTERAYLAAVPPCERVTVREDGAVAVTAWASAEYAGVMASGANTAAADAAPPAPVELTGPWTVRFPPGLGAPDQARFDALTSWTESADDGIRCFSGTATYTKEFDLPENGLAENERMLLDLGVVREIAEVRLNGVDLGILWKPPFHVDITDTAKPGRNSLEVRVTNLWPNRLIGDEQLPSDVDYSPGGPPESWPEWVLEGAQRPESGRVAFPAWKHYDKNAPLLDSGLLGPVRVWFGETVVLEP